MSGSVSAGPRRDVELLHRIGLGVQRVVREAARSPRRADVIALGADGTPTEQLDRVAETEVLRQLDELGVDWNVVSEEIGVVRRGGERSLVVDPVDGTTNAVRNLPFSALSLALGRDDLGGIEVGLVRDLDRGTTYWAERGGGAFRDGRPIRVRPWPGRGEIVLVNLGKPASERSVRLAGSLRRVRSLGCASLEMLLVAEGAADGYLFENADPNRNLRVTDIAAAYRILLEAGGGATDASGGSLEGFPLSVTGRTTLAAWGDVALAPTLRAPGVP